LVFKVIKAKNYEHAVANIDRPIEAWPMLTNGVATATIFTVTDISSQVGFRYLLPRSPVKIPNFFSSLFSPGTTDWYVI
jgi:hypothetical protein